MDTSRSRKEYMVRVNRVIDAIEANLDSPPNAAQLARLAGFSRFHFHRIFSACMGETLGRFVQRLRLERAAAQLLHRPDLSITEIALDAGFSSSSTFARSFRDNFGMTASSWRDGKCTDRNLGMSNRNPREAVHISSGHFDPATHQWTWRISMTDKKRIQTTITVQPQEPLEIAYVRHVGPYANRADVFRGLWGQILGWAGPRGLFHPPVTQMLCVYHDNPDVTDEERLRISLGITVPPETGADQTIGRMTLEGGPVARARFTIAADEYADAWQVVYNWLVESGYKPDDRLPYEIYRNNPEQHPENLHEIEICVPVQPL